MTEEILLVRDDHTIPWGFRLTGGRDFNGPLTVVRITGQSIAEKRGLTVGDIIIEINNEKTNNLCHNEAQRFIADGGNFLKLIVLRGSSSVIPPPLTPVLNTTPTLACSYEKKRTSSIISAESVYSLYEDDSFELLDQSEDEITEFHEPTEEEINQMLLENAEVIEEKGKNVLGVNFKRFIPKCEFIKDSAVFQVLQEEQVYKELSEKEQLKKTPNKRFSTFLASPDRPIPKPKPKSDTSLKNMIQEENNQNHFTNNDLENECKMISTNIETEPTEGEKIDEFDNLEESQKMHHCENQEVENNPNAFSDTNNPEENLEQKTEGNDEQEMENDKDESQKEFENQLAVVRNALSCLKQLPSLIQTQLADLQAQIDQLTQLKANKIQGIITKENIPTVDSEIIDDSNITEELTETNQIKETAEFNEECDEFENCDRDMLEQEEQEQEEQNSDSEITEIRPLDNEEVQDEQKREKEQNTSVGNMDEVTQKRRPACPLTPLPRPVVLPGGRIWRKPKDAFNEEFIAETLISQAEVLVGSTLGVNFRKYEPPKFDVSNSAVYKLIHNIESKKTGLADRDTIPSLQDYYQSPISARHFYCANLASARSSNEENSSKNDNNESKLST